MKVFCYFNLHTHLWSLKALDGARKGLVVAHAESLELADCEMRVSEAGRQRVLQEKRKNVHAGIVGTVVRAGGIRWRYRDVEELFLLTWPEAPNCRWTAFSYNPYKGKTFAERAEPYRPVLRAQTVRLDHKLGTYYFNDGLNWRPKTSR